MSYLLYKIMTESPSAVLHKKAVQQNHQIPIDLLNDLSSRFIINVPKEERIDLIRVCFQIELAHWFYLDFYCEEDNKLPKCLLKDFIRIIFGHIPFLQKYSSKVDSVIADWKEYKMAVPTYGAILLDHELKNVLLVQSYVAKASWGFPKGKVNKDEQPHHCAVREILEETGFDISHLINKEQFLEYHFNDQLIRLYIISDVPQNVKFHPKTRKEIKNIEWFPVSSLPASKKDQLSKTNSGPISFFMVMPFVKPLRKWIASQSSRLPEKDLPVDTGDSQYISQQQRLFAKLSQNEFSKYHETRDSNDTNASSSYKQNKFTNKPSYSPPPRMLRAKNMKQAVDVEKKKCLSPYFENEFSKYRETRDSNDTNTTNNYKQNKFTNKSSYSPPPRMIRAKNMKQAVDAEKGKCSSPYSEDRNKSVRRALDFTKKQDYEETSRQEDVFIPFSKTWVNFTLDTEALVAAFDSNLRNYST